MKYNRNKHHRRSVRLPGYDYSNPGAYFVTICSWQKECLFGDIVDGEMRLNEYGMVAAACLTSLSEHFIFVTVDYYVVMPNHVHLILCINRMHCRGVACNAPTGNDNYYSRISPKRNTLSTIIRSYKSAVTKQINQIRHTPGRPVWQRNYYERVIRNEIELNKIREYIRNNPTQWDIDKENAVNMPLWPHRHSK